MQAPTEMGLPDKTVLSVVELFYEIPESLLNVYLTYLAHHIDALKMHRSRTELSLLIRRSHGQLHGHVAHQIYDSLDLGIPDLLRQEEHACEEFRSNPRAYTSADPI